MKVNKELLKGSTVILVLSLLDHEPMYGYQMIKEIDKKSSGVFVFKEGTLYPILHSLEADDMIESYWWGNEGSRQRKYYRITKKGNHFLKEKEQEWETFRSAVDRVLTGGAYIWPKIRMQEY
ncbi:MAG: PadR family transcriptional regulator [Desulfocucumaceae bacterium]